jgi:hypothetical protein
MRVYFFFNLQATASIVHEVARYLKENYGWDDFAGLVVVKGDTHYSYLQHQTDVPYRYLDTTEEIEQAALTYEVDRTRIAEWERRLRMPLWHLVVADRNIGHSFVKGGVLPRTDIMAWATHDHIAQFVCYYLDYFERRLREFGAEAVFLPAAAALNAAALAAVAEWMKIPYLVLNSTRSFRRHAFAINNLQEQFTHINDAYNSWLVNPEQAPEIPGEVREYLEAFRTLTETQSILPGWTVDRDQRIASIREENLMKWVWEKSFHLATIPLVSKKRRLGPHGHLRQKHEFDKWWLSVRREWAIRSKQVPGAEIPRIGEEPYVYFPLHLNPEASTMVLAPNYVNQEFIVEILAKNIPLSHKLYVKEHPTMYGRRPSGFYKRIGAYPNVRIISPEADSLQLSCHADLVATITGTAGWEAILMDKPVLTFGENFYSRLGFSTPATDLAELGSIIKELIWHWKPDGDRTNRLLLYLTAVYQNSFELSSQLLWQKYKIGELPPEALTEAHRLAENLAQEILRVSGN